MKHAVIIGGGIAGLSAAYYLQRKSVKVTLLERDSSVGGAIKTVQKHERYLLELGPNTFLGSSDSICDLSRDIQIDHHLVRNETKKRFVYCGTKLHEVPVGPKQFLKSGLISGRGKLRIFAEPFIRSKTGDGESLAAFVTRRAGREILEALVDPFVSGVYAGDPCQLEIKSIFPKLVEIEEQYGSIFKGMRQLKGNIGNNSLLSFKWGMQTLPSRLHDLMQRDIRTDTTAESIEMLPNGRWMVYTDLQGGAVDADAVIIAAPTSEAARILMPHVPDIFSPMMGIPYVSLAVVHTAFRRSEIPIPLEGFGFLIPRREKIRLLGSIWSSSLFPNRAPNGETLVTSFMGGATDPYAVDLSDHDILNHVLSGLDQTMRVDTQPCFYNITRISQAIPQYTIGHAARLCEIENHLKKLPGIFLAGSYFTGISVADTIANSKKVASSVKAYLNSAA
jgi:oxygen-dependent protoporphyrinogen oxidase